MSCGSWTQREETRTFVLAVELAMRPGNQHGTTILKGQWGDTFSASHSFQKTFFDRAICSGEGQCMRFACGPGGGAGEPRVRKPLWCA